MKKIGRKTNKPRTRKQKIIIWTAAALTILKFLTVLIFFIYLYFWIKGR